MLANEARFRMVIEMTPSIWSAGRLRL